jgi:hypothetical protein
LSYLLALHCCFCSHWSCTKRLAPGCSSPKLQLTAIALPVVACRLLPTPLPQLLLVVGQFLGGGGNGTQPPTARRGKASPGNQRAKSSTQSEIKFCAWQLHK